MADFELQHVTTESQRGWQLDGQVEFHNPHIGTTVTYGMRPEGYDGVVVHERGGGGSVTVPYMLDSQDDLFVGCLLEERLLAGGNVWNVPRGMLQPDESHEVGALREFYEESGYLAVGRQVRLLAAGINSNTAVFDTSREGEGIKFFGVEFRPDELEPCEEGYKFPESVQPIDMTKFGEKILKVRFLPEARAIETPDMFTIAAVGLLNVSLWKKYKDAVFDHVYGGAAQPTSRRS